ncbi:MAG TPA: hypothetical protein DEA73_09445 [Peptococcaceae bacterium]|nr:MAG: hypothetical protein XD51_0638 [Moorella sp. 60_41]HBT48078.1 hypothetical protein [Peptococcaceae bacterium]
MVQESFPAVLYALLLQDLPESLLLSMAVFSLLNLNIRDRRVMFVGLLQTFTNLVRLLPIAFGMHSVILIISISVYTRLFTRTRLSNALLATLVCFAAIVTAELIYVKPLLSYTGLQYEEVFANPFLRAAFALPDMMVLLALALAKDYYNRKRGLVCRN